MSTTTPRCKKLIILEGVDGGGKSTLAGKLAEQLPGAIVHHHGPYRDLDNIKLAHKYIDSMLPALNGERDVILDRSWLSEPIYGVVFRQGADRIGRTTARMLARLALRCETTTVLCDPGAARSEANWLARKAQGGEYLDHLDQVRAVRHSYERAWQSWEPMPVFYDYADPEAALKVILSGTLASRPHAVGVRSAGRWGAQLVLVGEGFGSLKGDDHPYRWPFASLSEQGCSRWLTEQLDALESPSISEDELFWVNADEDLSFLKDYVSKYGGQPRFIALGVKASHALSNLALPHAIVNHPQSWKRFHSKLKYPLLPLLRKLRNDY